jgi:hypothetical protein
MKSVETHICATYITYITYIHILQLYLNAACTTYSVCVCTGVF